jgi:hypothetical protein
MPRLVVALLALFAVVGCSRKQEVVEAAPALPPAPAVSHATSPPGQMAPGAELPPGHPPLEGGMNGPAPQGGAGAPPAPAHGAAMSAGADAGDVKVPKAAGPDARTIAELYAQKDALKGKSVSIRGKVVKYNPGIMGKNWIHLRDGSGTAGKDNDVTVTSQEPAALGEVVTVQGKVALDQDIGMGAPYPVVVQEAKVAR